GDKIYQVIGEPTESERVSNDDVELVAERAGVDEDTAREAILEADGDLAKAISNLE
ncbi:MAG: Nascent polypeptide-associated complex protein, partial [Halobacteria archaeon]|nr:Nascent polypeptide-associated complex protein [Halobacteria archaeon]